MKYILNLVGALLVFLLITGFFFAPFLLLAYIFLVVGFMN